MNNSIFLILFFLIFNTNIYSQTIKILSPDKNSIWIGKSTQTIVFQIEKGNVTDDMNVTLQISYDGEKSWFDIESGKNLQVKDGINQFSFNNVPNESKTAILKIYSSKFPETKSDVFNIQPDGKIKYIEFTYPKKNVLIESKNEDKDKIIFKKGEAELIDSLTLVYKNKEAVEINVKIDSNVKTASGFYTWIPYRVENDNFMYNSFRLFAYFIKEGKVDTIKSDYFTILPKGVFKDKSKEYQINTGTTFNFQDNFQLTGAYFDIYKDFKELWINKTTNLFLGLTFYKSKLINNNKVTENNIDRVKIDNTINSYNLVGMIYSSFPYKKLFKLDYIYFGYLYAEKRKRDVESKINYKINSDTLIKDSSETKNSTIDDQFIGLSPLMIHFESKSIEIKAIPIFTYDIVSGSRNRSMFIMKFNLTERNSKINFGGEIREFIFNTNYDKQQTELTLYVAKDFAITELIGIFFK